MPNARSREPLMDSRDDEWLAAHLPLSASVGPAQQESESGLAFRTTFSGWFAVGMRDPIEGARAGRARDTGLRLNVTIRIPNVTTFVRDEEHAAILSGTVDFAPLGHGLAASRGDVRLFAPDPNGGKCMTIDLPFCHDGTSYFLSAERHMGSSAQLHLWPESSVMRAKLHRGHSRDCVVVAAGVLELTPLRALSAIPTVRGVGGKPLKRLSAPLAFGRFLAGELWNSWVLRRQPRAD